MRYVVGWARLPAVPGRQPRSCPREDLAKTAERYGQPWTAELLRTWFGGDQPSSAFGAGRDVPPWAADRLPGLRERLTAAAATGAAGARDTVVYLVCSSTCSTGPVLAAHLSLTAENVIRSRERHKDESSGASAGAHGELPQTHTHLALIEAVSMLTDGEPAERSASTASRSWITTSTSRCADGCSRGGRPGFTRSGG